MKKSIEELVKQQQQEIEKLKQELKETKQKLQFRQTEINDLRYTKRQLLKAIESMSSN